MRTGFTFDNRFVSSLPGDTKDDRRSRQTPGVLWAHAAATAVSAPKLLAHSPEVAALLGITEEDVASPEFAEIFAGNQVMPGARAYAACYGGHQFGHWAGQLGDGRALSLGEVVTSGGHRWELQLKGAGPTPYSRGSDGRAVLRSSLREFLCSEAMFHLGVPTTRALSLVTTGDQVLRDMLYDGRARHEPGAIVCRVAPSFVRFGTFELPAMRRDVELLEKAVEFTIDRDFPELEGTGEARRRAWFAAIAERTARMVTHWMRVGFVHGVMNTDNMSILGLTLDYGPYGWLEDFDPSWTPNTTDAEGRRYRFGAQPAVAAWNLTRLANALRPLFTADEPLAHGLEIYKATYEDEARRMTAAKLGFSTCDDDDLALAEELYDLMTAAEVDMTLFFRGLADVDPLAPSLAPVEDAFYREERRAEHDGALRAWIARYGARLRNDPMRPERRRPAMNAVNPRFVFRNYLAQEAIDLAEDGDGSRIRELLDTLRRPYDDQPERARFAAKRPEWARHRAGCSMLSCSS